MAALADAHPLPPRANTEILHYRTLIESALAYAGGSHTYDDVVREVEAGSAQFWPGPASCIVTQIDEQPNRKILQFFLAAGNAAGAARDAGTSFTVIVLV